MALARSTDSFLLRASQAAGATGSDHRKRPRRSTSPLSSRVSHTPATCWGLKFKMGSWNIEAARTSRAGRAADARRPSGVAAGGTESGGVFPPGKSCGLGSAALAPLGHASQLARAATGVGGLETRAPWRPSVSHRAVLPIKAATSAPRPFQHLPRLDSACGLPGDCPGFYRTRK